MVNLKKKLSFIGQSYQSVGDVSFMSWEEEKTQHLGPIYEIFLLLMAEYKSFKMPILNPSKSNLL